MKLSSTATWTGVLLILATGAIHLLEARDAFGEAAYKGVLFVANGVGAIVAALGIRRGTRRWGWDLGGLVAGGAIVGYGLSRTTGLPGLPAEPDAWLEPLGVASLVVEVVFVLLYLRVSRRARPSP